MLSIVVSWRNRNEIEVSIDSLLSIVEATEGDLTIVNFSGDGRMLRQLLKGSVRELQIITVRDQTYFNKPLAQNIGASCTCNPYLFFCDCDVLMEPKVVLDILHQVTSSDDRFGTLKEVRESKINSRCADNIVCFGYELFLSLRNGREVRITDNEEDVSDGTRQAPGLLLVHRRHFKEIGGYNSHLDGWGWEDQDMICRLTLGAGLTRIQHGTAVHLSHDDASRIKEYPYVDRWESRDRMFRKALDNYNSGHFLGTLQQDAKSYIRKN